MGDSDAEELSVGRPSPVSADDHHLLRGRHHRRSGSISPDGRHHHLLLGVEEDSSSVPSAFHPHRFGRSSSRVGAEEPSIDSASSATSAGGGGSSSAASQRHPTCALCKNHQQISVLRGHKRYCPWRTCLCELCYTTNKKRKVNAEQVPFPC